MERITYLIEQLQLALQKNADAAQLLTLTSQLQAELQVKVQQEPVNIGTKRVAIVYPVSRTTVPVQPVSSQPVTETNNKDEMPQEKMVLEVQPTEKIMEVLQVNEEEIEAELEEIRQKAEFAKKMEAQQHETKSIVLFDEEPDIPTLIHQPNFKEPEKPIETKKEINETVANGTQLSLNDQLAGQQTEIVQKLSESTYIKDLKKAIGINDRFVFINELFRGDEAMYERSIKTINNFSIYPEAQYWMERELKIKLGWLNDNAAVQEFYALVKRRFS